VSKPLVLLIAGLPAWGAAAADTAWVSAGAEGDEILLLEGFADTAGSAEPRPLTAGRQPAWSPDGSRLAFIGEGDGGGALYVVEVDGGDPRPLSASPAVHPRWSPDGSRIAYAGEDGEGHRLYSSAPDGTGRIPLSPAELDVVPWSAVWSPAGDRLAFCASTDGGAPRLWIVDAAGTNPRRLPGEGWHGVYAWTADDRLLITRDADLWFIGCDGENARRLTETGYCWNPALSPDGSRIVFHSTYHLYLLDPADGAVTQLTTEGRNSGPVWSPDGSRIAFVSARHGEDREIVVIDVEGAELCQISDNDVDDHSPVWRPTAPVKD
jgi:Tol biopolymer transport system component